MIIEIAALYMVGFAISYAILNSDEELVKYLVDKTGIYTPTGVKILVSLMSWYFVFMELRDIAGSKWRDIKCIYIKIKRRLKNRK